MSGIVKTADKKIGGSVCGGMIGLSAAGCHPYRTKFNFWIDYDLYIWKKTFADRHDTNPGVLVIHFTQSLDLGWSDGTPTGIGDTQNYECTSGSVPVTLGGSGNPPIDFDTIFNALTAYHSDSVPAVDNVSYVTYELNQVQFWVHMYDYLGHDTTFVVDTNAEVLSEDDFVP